jgi:hypothetical protein
VEAYNPGDVHRLTMCISDSASARYTWTSGHHTRLMRHRDVTTAGNTGGMDQVTNTCATCCRQ